MDIQNILQEMLNAMGAVLKTKWKTSKPVVEQLLERRRNSIQDLTDLWVAGKLTKEEYESRIDDEKHIWEAQLNVISAISKATLQHAINAAIDILRNIKIKF